MHNFFKTYRLHVIITIFCLVTIIAPCPGQADEPVSTKTVQVIGSSAVYGDNVVVARDRAIADGLSAAVERVTADYLPLESLVQNFQILNQTLYSQTDHFVPGYKVLTEARSKKTYRVMVQATVSVQRLIEQLSIEGIMVGQKAMPTILFLVVEQDIGALPPRFWWGEDMIQKQTIAESTMVETMTTKGLLSIDRKNLSEVLTPTVLTCEPDFRLEDVSELGMRLGSDVVIFGKAWAEIAQNTIGEKIKSFKGKVSVKAVLPETGEEIASSEQTAIAVNTDIAAGNTASLSKAGILAGRDLSIQIMAEWKKDIAAPILVEMSVSGTHNLANFVMFRRALKEIPGVKEIMTREMRPDDAILAIDYEGNVPDLAEALILKTFESFGINITEVSDTMLKVALVSG
jgi:hypothetical protein